jgi:hydrogenase expression/formation protein HypC
VTCDPQHGCITCGDVAIPMQVLAVDHERGLALCADEDGNRETVEIALVLPVAPSDELLVHAATAIAKLEDPAVPRMRGAEEAVG